MTPRSAERAAGPFARLAMLETENDQLRERIRQLEAELTGEWAPPLVLGLTAKEAFILALLRGRERVRRDTVMAELYADRSGETPQDKIVDVFVCKLRKKLAPFGVKIVTIYGQGYALAPGAMDKLDALAAPAAKGQAA